MKKYGCSRTALQVSVLATLGLLSQSSLAGGLEYTKQSVAPFFEAGDYAELSYAYVSPNIEGKDKDGHHIDNMMDDFGLAGAAVKVAPSPNTALALIYERPFGLKTKYPSGSNFRNSLGTTVADVTTDNYTLLGGGKTANNVWLYGGVQVQKADATISSASPSAVPIDATTVLPAEAFYQATPQHISNAFAPVVGIGYEIPKISLRTSLTYRGKTKHDVRLNESMNVYVPAIDTTLPALPKTPTSLSLEFPQSINLDFQTGIAKDTLLTVNTRWVNWKDFKVTTPATLELTQEPIAAYLKDSYGVEVALGRQFTPKFSAEVRAGYDSGTGTPLSALGPYDDTTSIAVGGQYNINPNLFVAGGVQYLKFKGGDIATKLDGKIAKVDDGDGYALGMKVGYHF